MRRMNLEVRVFKALPAREVLKRKGRPVVALCGAEHKLAAKENPNPLPAPDGNKIDDRPRGLGRRLRRSCLVRHGGLKRR